MKFNTELSFFFFFLPTEPTVVLKYVRVHLYSLHSATELEQPGESVSIRLIGSSRSKKSDDNLCSR